MDVHYLRTSCITLQGEKRDNTTIRCFFMLGKVEGNVEPCDPSTSR
nr:MAG TPA: hypothetical protein [Caudoviricetes sp.]